ncbi:MAG: hypothetical protein C0469_17415 [Cyanobacteria bacterium DS2.3.42]|nr:hypothetical protein [Cyanobacteria bacterium DS2.3.42]
MRKDAITNRYNWRAISLLFALLAVVCFALPSIAADPVLPVPQQIIEPPANEDYTDARARMNRLRQRLRTRSSELPTAAPPSPPTLSYPDAAVPPSVAYPTDILEDARIQKEALYELRKRPLQYWRYYAMQPPRPILTTIFVLFFCITLNLVFKKRVAVATDCIGKSFWKTLGSGILCLFLLVTTTRLCYEVEFFEPLAVLSMGVLQLLCLFGLAISTRMFGQSIMRKFNFCQPAAGADPTVLQILVWIALGVAILACFYFVPPISLPFANSYARLAPRVGMLLSILGMGALVRTRLGRKELS